MYLCEFNKGMGGQMLPWW